MTASIDATLADLHPGRVVLGIGRGDNAVRTLGLKPVPTAGWPTPCRDPRARRRPAATLAGAEIRIRWADEDQVPIMMSATGPKNLRVSGALADIAMVYVGVNGRPSAWAIEHVRAGAEEAGPRPRRRSRSPRSAAMWVDDDQEQARDACRWAPAACANHIADTMRRNPDHDMPERMTRLLQARDDYDYYEGHLSSTPSTPRT